MITSFIKYIGGKGKVLDTILKNIPMDIKEYREPMVGSGIVLLGLLQTRKRIEKIQIGDFDYDVYNVWSNVINNTDELMKKAIEIKTEVLENNDTSKLDTFGQYGVDAAATYLLSNICKTLGNYGSFDPERVYRGRLIDFEHNYRYKLYSVSNLVGSINIRNEDYEWAFKEDGEKVCIFLDPPYVNVACKSGYYKDHNIFDYDRLTEILRSTKHKFIMTLDISEYSESLKQYFNVEKYNIFYSLAHEWRQEALIKNF